MATGASTCDLAIILIDARQGVLTQTRRHSFIVSLLGIRHVVVAINKMDLVGFTRAVFEQIRQDYLDFAGRLNLPDIHFLPISALNGDNVVHRSDRDPLVSTASRCSNCWSRSRSAKTATSTSSACRCSMSTAPTSTFAAFPARSPAAS
jgi:translation elongation factor EF-1alpha